MKITKNIEITKGPNIWFYIGLGIFCYIAYDTSSYLPLLIWLGIMVVLTLAVIWLSLYNEREREKILKDFPNNAYIQEKYKNYGGK